MEIEFKFQVPAERLPAVTAEVAGAGSQRTPLQARYFDTAAGALAARGVALRLRKEGRRWVQTLKALGDGPVQRLEHNVEREGKAAPEPDLALHDGTPAGARLAQALAEADGPLVEVYATDIARLTRVLTHGDSRIELALDLGQVLVQQPDGAPPRSAEVCELELELLDGQVQDLTALACDWAGRHGLWFSTVSKAERGLRLARGQVFGPAVRADAPALAWDAGFAPGAPLQRAVLAACLAQVLPNASEVAAGSEDAEHLHQLRVGLRRLRTALRALAPLAEGLDPGWQAPLAQCFGALGARRDRQLLVEGLQPQLRAAGAPSIPLPPLGVPADPGAAVRASGFQAVLVQLIGHVAAPAGKGLGAHAARRLLRRRLRRWHRRLLRAGERFDALEPAARHRLRKRLKRLRYLAEFVGPGFDAARAAAYVQALERAQDRLGEHLDEQAALHSYEAMVQHAPQAWFAVGWLRARQQRSARRAGKAVRALRRAPQFWAKD